MAGRDYQERMAAIFQECRRVRKPNGIMTLMFTHKATGAWDALAKGLMDAASSSPRPGRSTPRPAAACTSATRGAANSTVFLACRPRARENAAEVRDSVAYWEDVEPRVAKAVRTRVAEFQEAGIAGVDLYLARFGPALERFSRNWPFARGTPEGRGSGRLGPLRRHAGGRPGRCPPRSEAPALEQLTHKGRRKRISTRPPRSSCWGRTPSGHPSSSTMKCRSWLAPSAWTWRHK